MKISLKTIFLFFFVIIATSFPVNAQYVDYEEKPLIEEFHWQLKKAVGIGSVLMSDNNEGYLNLKVFTSRYGEDYAGMRFLGFGAIVKKETQFSFSPVALNANNWLISVDIQANAANSVGVSFNLGF